MSSSVLAPMRCIAPPFSEMLTYLSGPSILIITLMVRRAVGRSLYFPQHLLFLGRRANNLFKEMIYKN
jgi:hypothetical protein